MLSGCQGVERTQQPQLTLGLHAQVSTAFRQAVRKLAPPDWRLVSANTVPAHHPLRASTAAAADVPAAAARHAAATAGLRQGQVATARLQTDAILLQPDFARRDLRHQLLQMALAEADSCCVAGRALKIHQGRMILCVARPTKAGWLWLVKEKGSRECRLPLHTHFAAPGSGSPCGQYCLLKVQHRDAAEPKTWWALLDGLQSCKHAQAGKTLTQPACRSLIVWSVAAAERVATLCSGYFWQLNPESQLKLLKFKRSGNFDGLYNASKVSTCAWLPDSTICCSEPGESSVRVSSPKGKLLGSAAVHFELSPAHDDFRRLESYHPTGLRAAPVPRPCGSFLAAQSHQSLLVLAAPSCSTHLELPLDPAFSHLIALEDLIASEELGVSVDHAWWAPDCQRILVLAGAVAICSLSGRCWQQVISPQMPCTARGIHGWAMAGVLVTVRASQAGNSSSAPNKAKAPGNLAVLDPPRAAVVPVRDAVPDRLRGAVCSPDNSWVAARLQDKLVIVRAKSGRVVGRPVFPYHMSPAAPVWTQDGSALVCQGAHDVTYRLCFS